MSRKQRPLAALAMVAMVAGISAGCSSAPAKTATGSSSTGISGDNTAVTNRDKAVKFAECMRDNGVREFPDPDASGQLTIDGVLNGSSLDPSTAAWKQAISACKNLEPPGFTGHKRSAQEQEAALPCTPTPRRTRGCSSDQRARQRSGVNATTTGGEKT